VCTTVRINRSIRIWILLEFDVAIVLVVGLAVVGIIGYKSLSKYLTHETVKVTNDQKALYEHKILQYQQNFEKMENSRDGYRQKYKHLQNNYDIDLDDDEISDEGEMSDIIPEIASALFPKMPPKLKELLGKEELQNAIFKVAEKNADKIPDWIAKYVNKTSDSDGSNSNKSDVLKEQYI